MTTCLANSLETCGNAPAQCKGDDEECDGHDGGDVGNGDDDVDGEIMLMEMSLITAIVAVGERE